MPIGSKTCLRLIPLMIRMIIVIITYKLIKYEWSHIQNISVIVPSRLLLAPVVFVNYPEILNIIKMIEQQY